MDSKYHRLYDELEFTRELLGIGLTELRKATLENKGVYFQAFTSLSLGIERLCKICLIIRYYKQHGRFPDNSRSISNNRHNLIKLVGELFDINSNNNLKEIHINILKHLSDFADSSGRYSNINYLTEGSTIDPISAWKTIDSYILEKLVSKKQKERLRKEMACTYSIFSNIPTLALGFESEDRYQIESVEGLLEQLVTYKFISGYRVLLVIQLLEEIYNYLNEINESNRNKKYYLHELNRVFSVFFYGSDYEKRKRKNFIRKS